MVFNDIFNETDIKEHLKNYKKIINFHKIQKDSHIKYFTHVKDNKYNYNNGGFLKYNYNDYLILYSGKTSWSVQKNNNVFFVRVYIDENELQNKIDNNNKILKKLGVKVVNIDTSNNNTSNNDIFAKLSKPIKVPKNIPKELKHKFKLHKWKFLKIDEIVVGMVIIYIDLNKESKSNECLVRNIIYNKNNSIKSLKVDERTNVLDKRPKYSWYIIPHKYYIFCHPKSLYLLSSYS
jgi:hypothetical protein